MRTRASSKMGCTCSSSLTWTWRPGPGEAREHVTAIPTCPESLNSAPSLPALLLSGQPAQRGDQSGDALAWLCLAGCTCAVRGHPAPAREGADSHGVLEAGLPWESAPAMAPERQDCFSGGAAKIHFTEGRADLGWDLPVTKRVLARAALA